MVGRRWIAWFDRDHLVLKRQRLLPWPKSDVKWVHTAAVVDIRPISAGGGAKGRAHVTVQNPAVPSQTEVFEVQFAAQHLPRANWLILHRLVSSPTSPGSELAPTLSPARTPVDVASPAPPPRAKPAVKTPKVRGPLTIVELGAPHQARSRRSTIVAMRADDGKRKVWLWQQGGRIHASLAPVGEAFCRRLNPTEVARLLLTDPVKAMPAIRALTGLDDDFQALARMRSWPGNAVTLPASDLAGRQPSKAIKKPSGKSADGSIRTVSGGLPGLGKRRK